MTLPRGWTSSIYLAAKLDAEFAELANQTADSSPIDDRAAPELMALEDSALAAFDARILDVDLRTASRSRFFSKHYSDAVEAGVKALNQCLRTRTGRSEDGDGLMTIVFSPNNPLLRLNRLKSKADESAQRGHMLLCQGVVAAWRNPRAHNDVDDEPEKALMMLELVNELITVSKSAVRTRQRRKP